MLKHAKAIDPEMDDEPEIHYIEVDQQSGSNYSQVYTVNVILNFLQEQKQGTEFFFYSTNFNKNKRSEVKRHRLKL